MIALLGIKDFLRLELPGAIQKWKEAGMRVRMATCDNLLIEWAIALECRIIKPDAKDSLVKNGQHFINLVEGGKNIFISVVCKVCRTKQCDCPISEQQEKEQFKHV